MYILVHSRRDIVQRASRTWSALASQVLFRCKARPCRSTATAIVPDQISYQACKGTAQALRRQNPGMTGETGHDVLVLLRSTQGVLATFLIDDDHRTLPRIPSFCSCMTKALRASAKRSQPNSSHRLPLQIRNPSLISSLVYSVSVTATRYVARPRVANNLYRPRTDSLESQKVSADPGA